MRLKHLIITAAVAAIPSLAFAHDVAKGSHGGQVVDDRGHHVEFVATGNEVLLYLTDEKDVPIASKGASGRIILQNAGQTTTTALAPAEPNILTAKLDKAFPTGSKLVVSAKLSDGHDIAARFVVK